MIVGLFVTAKEASAVSIGSMTLQTLTGIVIGLTMGATVLLGNCIGKKDYKSASKTIASAIMLFVITAIVFTYFIVIAAAPIAKVMNAPEEAYDLTISYIWICGYGVITTIYLINFEKRRKNFDLAGLI